MMNGSIDAAQVLSAALSDMAPAQWRMLRPKRSHFVWAAIGHAAAAAELLALLVALYCNPDIVIGLREATQIDALYGFWRGVDFVVGGLFVAGAVVMTSGAVRDLGTLEYQALVLMPEGFVLQKSSTPETVTTVSFGAIRDVQIAVRNGDYSLRMPRADGRRLLVVSLDRRFGKPKEIARTIARAYRQYGAVAMRQG